MALADDLHLRGRGEDVEIVRSPIIASSTCQLSFGASCSSASSTATKATSAFSCALPSGVLT
jgi:hypothetical protein